MAKVIKYNLSTKVNRGTAEYPDWKEILSPVEMLWSEANEAIAAREAYNGAFSVTDDGSEEPRILTLGDRVTLIEDTLKRIQAFLPNLTV